MANLCFDNNLNHVRELQIANFYVSSIETDDLQYNNIIEDLADNRKGMKCGEQN